MVFTAWFPGAGFKRKAKIWAKSSAELRNGPFDLLKEKMVCLLSLL
jgi:hypothetical protein